MAVAGALANRSLRRISRRNRAVLPFTLRRGHHWAEGISAAVTPFVFS